VVLCSYLSNKTILFLYPLHNGPTCTVLHIGPYWFIEKGRPISTCFFFRLNHFDGQCGWHIRGTQITQIRVPSPSTHTHARTHTLLCARSASGRILVLSGVYVGQFVVTASGADTRNRCADVRVTAVSRNIYWCQLLNVYTSNTNILMLSSLKFLVSLAN